MERRGSRDQRNAGPRQVDPNLRRQSQGSRLSPDERRAVRLQASGYVLELQQFCRHPVVEQDGGWAVVFMTSRDLLWKKWSLTLSKYEISTKLDYIRKHSQEMYGALATWGMRNGCLSVVAKMLNLNGYQENQLEITAYGLTLLAGHAKVPVAFSKPYGQKLARGLTVSIQQTLKEAIRKKFGYVSATSGGGDDILSIIEEMDAMTTADPAEYFWRWLFPDDDTGPDPLAATPATAKAAIPARREDLFESEKPLAIDLLATSTGKVTNESVDLLGEDNDGIDGLLTTEQDDDLLSEGGKVVSRPSEEPDLLALEDPQETNGLKTAVTFLREYAGSKGKGASSAATLLARHEGNGLAISPADLIKQTSIIKRVAGL